MKKNKSSIESGRGVRTFIIYFSILFVIVLISLGIKSAYLIRESKYDGKYINMAIVANKNTREIIGFNNQENRISRLIIKGNLDPLRIPEEIGIIVDSQIELDKYPEDKNLVTICKDILFSNTKKTDLTIFDAAKLLILSKKVQSNQINEEEVELSMPPHVLDKIVNKFFMNDIVRTENISIGIVNATDTSGIGKKLERSLTNLGFNVVSVSTERKPEKKSKIEYSSESTYSLIKIQKLLKYPKYRTDKKLIADIIITIGEDSHKFIPSL